MYDNNKDLKRDTSLLAIHSVEKQINLAGIYYINLKKKKRKLLRVETKCLNDIIVLVEKLLRQNTSKLCRDETAKYLKIDNRHNHLIYIIDTCPILLLIYLFLGFFFWISNKTVIGPSNFKTKQCRILIFSQLPTLLLINDDIWPFLFSFPI